MSNLTITVEEETLKKARIRALTEGTSVNEVLRGFLESYAGVKAEQAAALVIGFMGPNRVTALLILSQVILSLQLPFAVIPLVQFTSDRKKMGEFVNRRGTIALAWFTTAAIVVLNLLLLWQIYRGV